MRSKGIFRPKPQVLQAVKQSRFELCGIAWNRSSRNLPQAFILFGNNSKENDLRGPLDQVRATQV
jgi:hypothetical protein